MRARFILLLAGFLAACAPTQAELADRTDAALRAGDLARACSAYDAERTRLLKDPDPAVARVPGQTAHLLELLVQHSSGEIRLHVLSAAEVERLLGMPLPGYGSQVWMVELQGHRSPAGPVYPEARVELISASRGWVSYRQPERLIDLPPSGTTLAQWLGLGKLLLDALTELPKAALTVPMAGLSHAINAPINAVEAVTTGHRPPTASLQPMDAETAPPITPPPSPEEKARAFLRSAEGSDCFAGPQGSSLGWFVVVRTDRASGTGGADGLVLTLSYTVSEWNDLKAVAVYQLPPGATPAEALDGVVLELPPRKWSALKTP